MSGLPSIQNIRLSQPHVITNAASANQRSTAQPNSSLAIAAGHIAEPIVRISPQQIGNDFLGFLIMQTAVSTGLKCQPNDIKTLMRVSKPLAEQFRNTTHSATIDCSQYLNLKNDESPTAHIDALKKNLSKYPNLTTLKLTGPVDNEILSALKQCTQLKTLDLSGCNNVGDDGLKHLAKLTQLQHLDLSTCRKITDTGLAHLANLTKLQHLKLGDCIQITDAGIAHLANLKQLKHLDLSFSRKITDAGLAHLVNLTQLQHLNLSASLKITDAGLPHLANMPQLKHLDLYLCNIPYNAIETFKQNVSCKVYFTSFSY